MNEKIGENFMITQDGMLVMKERICVPNVDDLRKVIIEEAYCSAYVMYGIGVHNCNLDMNSII